LRKVDDIFGDLGAAKELTQLVGKCVAVVAEQVVVGCSEIDTYFYGYFRS